MASLNHVCMWSEHGWTRITATEAAAMHPGGTVSAHSGLFMCDLCGQYVTLTDGYVRVPYFKHSASEANKNCPERTFGASYVPTYMPSEHELPIRMTIINRNTLAFELGLLCVPSALLSNQEKQFVAITTSTGKRFEFSFERLNPDFVTYLPIGNEPSQQYFLEVSNELAVYWPKSVCGISDKGAVFDKKTGKMILQDADVQINRKYYILTKRNLSWYYENTCGIRMQLKCEQRIGWLEWKVYEVEANELTEDAAKLFLDYHCRLTDIPLEICPIWPIHIETPYLIRHNGGNMIMHISGNRQIMPKAFPTARIESIRCTDRDNRYVVNVNCKDRQQLISAGKANVLQYLYLWKEPLSQTTTDIIISVTDLNGEVICEGEQNKIPKESILRITTPFDGEVWLISREQIIERIKISANKQITINNLCFGISIKILQGLDIIWCCSFLKQKRANENKDTELYNKLMSYRGNEIPVTHSLGNLILKFENYPKVKQWILHSVKNGYAPKGSINYLKKLLIEEFKYKEGEK